jgi:hypothetical protein
MHLKLEELQRVAKRTIKEEHALKSLREELFRVFGPPVMVSNNCVRVAEAANEQLDLFESTGRETPRGDFKTSILIEAANNKSVHVRKVVARLLPERLAAKMLGDSASEVRCAAARRSAYTLVKEAVKKHPGDDQLRTIARARRLTEAGLPDAKPVTDHFDMYGEEPLTSAKQQAPVDDMPDTWYERLAHKLCKEYGGNLEGQWEEILATRVVASHYSTTGVRLDRDKLLKSIFDCLKEREDAVLGEGSLLSIASRLRRESYLDEGMIPILEETHDPLDTLLESNLSSGEFISRAEEAFRVRKSRVPAGIKKYRLGESREEVLIPVNAKTPGGINEKSERALDAYVEAWNKQQAMRGEPFRISWGPHPVGVDMVGFNLELK